MAISRPIRPRATLRQIAVALRIGSPLTSGLSIGSSPRGSPPGCILGFAGGLFVAETNPGKAAIHFHLISVPARSARRLISLDKGWRTKGIQ